MSYVGIGNRQDYIADFPTQEFSGNSTTTTFTLNFEAVTGAVRVAVDNVLQPADGSSYYVNGNSLTFTSAPASGTNNISVVYLGTVRNISSVSDNAITAAKLNSAAITGQTAETSIADDDLVLIYDDSATALRKMTKSNFISGAGITEADQWRLNTSFSGDATPIASNLERVDNASFGYIGTGMSQSSGIFTFPSTGIYKIDFFLQVQRNVADDPQIFGEIQVTTNNSTYTGVAYALYGSTYANQRFTVGTSYFFDVTNTSTHKVRFDVTSNAGNNTVVGNTDINQTFMNFIRLGDT